MTQPTIDQNYHVIIVVISMNKGESNGYKFSSQNEKV